MRGHTTHTFIDKAKEIHGDYYDYSKVEYVNLTTPVTLICRTHGEFQANANNHLFNKSGCPKCAIARRTEKRRLDFESRAREVHGDTYDYSKVDYVTLSQPVLIICKKHGEFHQIPSVHFKGSGCKLCSERKLDSESFINRAKSVHGNRFIYDRLEYTGYEEEVVVCCREHGYFSVKASSHLSKNGGCRQCFVSNMRLTTDDFIHRAQDIHSNKYVYDKVVYRSKKNKVIITCPKHGDFKQAPFNHLNGQGCPVCPTTVSKPHQMLVDFLTPLVERIEINTRTVLPNGQELDIYLPDYKLGIEIDGVWFHSGKFNRGKNYHQNKLDLAESNGITLMQFWDFEIADKFDIVSSMLKAKLGLVESKIPARKTKVVELSPKQYKDFLERTHLQGAIQSNIKLGISMNGRILSVLGATKRNGAYHIDRFSTELNTIVIGGFSKLFKHLPVEGKVVSYSSNRYSQGNLYASTGFELVRQFPWMLFYTDGRSLYSRNKYQKHKLTEMVGYSEDKSADEILKDNNIFPVWSSGTKCWVKEVQQSS